MLVDENTSSLGWPAISTNFCFEWPPSPCHEPYFYSFIKNIMYLVG